MHCLFCEAKLRLRRMYVQHLYSIVNDVDTAAMASSEVQAASQGVHCRYVCIPLFQKHAQFNIRASPTCLARPCQEIDDHSARNP